MGACAPLAMPVTVVQLSGGNDLVSGGNDL